MCVPVGVDIAGEAAREGKKEPLAWSLSRVEDVSSRYALPGGCCESRGPQSLQPMCGSLTRGSRASPEPSTDWLPSGKGLPALVCLSPRQSHSELVWDFRGTGSWSRPKAGRTARKEEGQAGRGPRVSECSGKCWIWWSRWNVFLEKSSELVCV